MRPGLHSTNTNLTHPPCDHTTFPHSPLGTPCGNTASTSPTPPTSPQHHNRGGRTCTITWTLIMVLAASISTTVPSATLTVAASLRRCCSHPNCPLTPHRRLGTARKSTLQFPNLNNHNKLGVSSYYSLLHLASHSSPSTPRSTTSNNNQGHNHDNHDNDDGLQQSSEFISTDNHINDNDDDDANDAVDVTDIVPSTLLPTITTLQQSPSPPSPEHQDDSSAYSYIEEEYYWEIDMRRYPSSNMLAQTMHHPNPTPLSSHFISSHPMLPVISTNKLFDSEPFTFAGVRFKMTFAPAYMQVQRPTN